MKKLLLFEIELECASDEFNGFVAADNAREAEEMAREIAITDYIVLCAKEEASINATTIMDDIRRDKLPREVKMEIHIEELENMRLTMLVELGEVIVS